MPKKSCTIKKATMLDGLDCVCEFFRSSVHPSVEDVLARVDASSVCTSTQCFQSDTDAFGLLPSVPNETAWRAEIVAAMALLAVSLCRACYKSVTRCTPSKSVL